MKHVFASLQLHSNDNPVFVSHEIVPPLGELGPLLSLARNQQSLPVEAN